MAVGLALSVVVWLAVCSDHRQTGNRSGLASKGISIPTADLMIGAVALVHDLTLVTNSTADFKNIPGLRLDDWLTS